MSAPLSELNRRTFLKASAFSIGGLALGQGIVLGADKRPLDSKAARMSVSDLPKGNSPPTLAFSHFPDRLHAYVWRNWQLVPTDRLAKVVGTTSADILRIGRRSHLPQCNEVNACGKPLVKNGDGRLVASAYTRNQLLIRH